MIYKFECKEINECSMEIELIDELVVFSINETGEIPLKVFIEKKDVYHLIGALHLLHKEMK